MDFEYRDVGLKLERKEEGIVEAYLTKWGTIDEYRSTFHPESFRRTIKERDGKIRLLWNHRDLAGKVLEIKEDATGPRVIAKFNLKTPIGLAAWNHVNEGDIDSFSFGFTTKKDQYRKDGIREIQDIDLYEVSPVYFPANAEAKIVAKRSKPDDSWIMDSMKTLIQTLRG